MDACTYKEITGLDNYYGFKSLLANSSRIGTLYTINDDTIVFNRVVQFSSDESTEYVLNNNQVGVLLNLVGQQRLEEFGGNYPIIATSGIKGINVNFEDIWVMPNDLCLGQVFIESIFYYGPGSDFGFVYYSNVVLAIFDLY